MRKDPNSFKNKVSENKAERVEAQEVSSETDGTRLSHQEYWEWVMATGLLVKEENKKHALSLLTISQLSWLRESFRNAHR